MSKKLRVIFGLVIVFSISLGLFIQSITSNKSIPPKGLENFEEFNKLFHTDSVFQLSRVNFPIEGKLIDGFDRQSWTTKNWELMKIPVSEKASLSDYRHLVKKNDKIVIEKFWIDNSGIIIERRFRIVDGKWFLVYYNDVNL